MWSHIRTYYLTGNLIQLTFLFLFFSFFYFFFFGETGSTDLKNYIGSTFHSSIISMLKNPYVKSIRTNLNFSNPMTQAQPDIKCPKPIIAENQLTQSDFLPNSPNKITQTLLHLIKLHFDSFKMWGFLLWDNYYNPTSLRMWIIGLCSTLSWF